LGIGIIGFGRMGRAIAISLSGHIKGRVIAFDPDSSKIAGAGNGIIAASSLKELCEKCSVIFLCVKPKDLAGVLEGIKSFVSGQTIISIAAGKKIPFIEKMLGKKKIVRVMPNINALAGASVNAFSCANISAAEKEKVKELLCGFGEAIEFEEKHFDAITALSGSGPAFVSYFAKCLAEAGEENGLPPDESQELAILTIFGTAKLLLEKNYSCTQVMEMVTSPNGTTQAGRKILEGGRFKKAVQGAVSAAAKRSEELGKDG